MRTCTKCKLPKEESDFYQNPKSLRFDSWCRECKLTLNLNRDPKNQCKKAAERYWANPEDSRKKDRERYWKNPEKQRERLRARSPETRKDGKLRSQYRLSISEFETMLSEQGGGCAICGDRSRPFCVDHCHRLGMVRGVLCRRCNTGIGMLQDSATLVLKAHEYLKKHLTKPANVIP